MEQNSIGLPPKKSLVIAAFAAIYIIWGSTYIGILYAIEHIPPFLMAATRFIVAGALLLLWCLLKGQKFPPARDVAKISFSGLLMLFMGNGAVTWVEQFLPTGLAAIIVATVPLWFVLMDKREWNYNFSTPGILFGLLIGFIGVILLFLGKSSTVIFNDIDKMIAVAVLLLGTMGWAAGSLFSKYQKMQGSTFMKVALQMLAAGVAFAITSFAAKEQDEFSFNQLTTSSIVSLSYLIIFGSLVGYLAYMWLLSVRPASLVGTYAYVNPVVAVFLGWWLVGEPISAQQIFGLAVIIAGLLLVNIARDRKQTKAEKSSETPVLENNS